MAGKIISVYFQSPVQSVLLLYSRLAPGLVPRTVKKSKLLGSTVLKPGSEKLQQQCKQGSPCKGVQCSCHDQTIQTNHPTFLILNCTAPHLLWQSFTEKKKKKNKQFGATVLKQGSEQQCKQSCPCQAVQSSCQIWNIPHHSPNLSYSTLNCTAPVLSVL